MLKPALRNYILSNSQKTFKRNYQPRHISFNLIKYTFSNAKSNPENRRLYKLLKQAYIAQNKKTPISLNKEELKKLNFYSYIVSLAKEYQKANAKYSRNNPVTQRAQVAVRSKQQRLANRMIEEKRKQYFNKADKLQALGESVKKAFPNANNRNNRKSISYTAKAYLAMYRTTSISKFMHKDNLDNGVQQQKFINMVFEFLAHRPANTDYIFKDLIKKANGTAPHYIKPAIKLKRNYRCLFGCQALSERHCLTKHTENFHKPSFKTPFYCPECQQRRFSPVVIKNLDHWYAHAERKHSTINTPSFQPDLKDALTKRYKKPPKAPCLFCQAEFYVGQSYAQHFSKHASKEFKKVKGFNCPQCRRKGKGLVHILSRKS